MGYGKLCERRRCLLLAYDGLVDQALAEDEALVSPFEGLLDNGATSSEGGAWKLVSEARSVKIYDRTYRSSSNARG